eukprot:371656_1
MGSPLTLKERKKITNLFSFNKHMKQYKKDRNIKSIPKRFIYSIKTVRKYVDIWLQTNQHKTSWELHQRNIGRRRGYTTFHLFKLKEIIDEDGTLYLDELANGMQNQCGVMFTISTIVRMINRLQYTRKKVWKIGLHFNYNDAKVYFLTLKLMGIRKEQLVFAERHTRII